jgi:superfamily II DNA or RNA helicase
MISLRFVSGTIELRGTAEEVAAAAGDVARWDVRAACHRAPALEYPRIVRALVRQGLEYEDRARAYETLPAGARRHLEPRGYQREALDAWRRADNRGVVVLPTGAGKTLVATLAIELRRRATLVVAPTLDLVRQWFDVLGRTFPDCQRGVIGGGDYSLAPLTVTTYDSAYLHMEHIGDRFGLVVFDECHHLPSESYALAAEACLAPFRLGLSATPERADGRDALLATLVGPVVYRRDIVEMSGSYLAAYETKRIVVHLSDAERVEYDTERRIYLDFVRSQGIRLGSPEGWNEFVIRSSTSAAGRRAMKAYQRQRTIAFAAPAKLDELEALLSEHRADRVIVFTQDNATAYDVSRRFLVPTITHKTKVTERSEILAGLSAGTYGAVATSKVLNEGVDVPEANVAVVISGSGSVREHVQRLGRILRPLEGKRAVLYEIVTAETSETATSERRRDHVAYR